MPRGAVKKIWWLENYVKYVKFRIKLVDKETSVFYSTTIDGILVYLHSEVFAYGLKGFCPVVMFIFMIHGSY